MRFSKRNHVVFDASNYDYRSSENESDTLLTFNTQLLHFDRQYIDFFFSFAFILSDLLTQVGIDQHALQCSLHYIFTSRLHVCKSNTYYFKGPFLYMKNKLWKM